MPHAGRDRPSARGAGGPRPGRDDRARHRHHQGRPDPRGARASSATRFSQAGPDRRRSSATSATGPRRWPAGGRPRRPSRKVLGLGVRGIGWRDIEIERLPTGQPSVRLHGRAAARAEQLGMERIAVSITPRIGLRGRDRVRGPDGRRPVRLPARHRGAARRARAAASSPGSSACGRPPRPVGWRARHGRSAAASTGSGPVPERAPVGFGRRDAPRDGDSRRAGPRRSRPAPTKLDDDIVGRAHPGATGPRPQGLVRQAARHRRLARLRRRGAARLPGGRAAAGVGLVTLAVPESLQPLFAAKVVEATTMALPEDDVEEVDPEPALARILDHEHDAIVVGPGLRPGSGDDRARPLAAPDRGRDRRRARSCSTPRRSARWPRWTAGGRATRRPAVLTPHAGEFARLRAGSGDQPDDDGDLERRRRRPGSTAALDAAATWGSVVVLKGARTIIAAPDGSAAIAPFENPALATGGTGDVLAGAIGSLLAQGLEPFAAARLGRLPARAGRRRRPRPVRGCRAARLGPAGRAGDRAQAAGGRDRTADRDEETRVRRAGSRVGAGVARTGLVARDPGRSSLNRPSAS